MAHQQKSNQNLVLVVKLDTQQTLIELKAECALLTFTTTAVSEDVIRTSGYVKDIAFDTAEVDDTKLLFNYSLSDDRFGDVLAFIETLQSSVGTAEPHISAENPCFRQASKLSSKSEQDGESLDDLLSCITTENRHGEFDWG